MKRRNFLKSLVALPVVGGMAACGKGEPESAAPGPKLEPTWLVEYDDDGGNRKTFLGMFPETARATLDYSARPAILADAVLPTWTRFNVPRQTVTWINEPYQVTLWDGSVLRGLDLPLEDLNKLSTP